MKVLFFSRDYTTHDRRFLAKLAEVGHDVHYLRLEDDGRSYESQPLPAGVTAVPWSGGTAPRKTIESWLRLMPALKQAIERTGPDIIHAGPVYSCGFMAALSGFHPVVTMSWGADVLLDAAEDPALAWMSQYAIGYADVFACDCRAVRDRVAEWLDLSSKTVVQFPWGVDLRRFKPGRKGHELRRRVGWKDDVFVIVSARQWEPLYGIDTVIEGFRRAHAETPRLRLILLGTGSRAGAVEAAIAGSGLDGFIHRPGTVSPDELADCFDSADLYVSLSRCDGSSISLLEAMASGLPVVVSDLPANREWVGQNANGWLVPSEDAQSFAEMLTRVAASPPDKLAEIGRANRARAEELANWDRNFELLLAAYARLNQSAGAS